MRHLTKDEEDSILKFYQRAAEIAKNSDCKEANYGAVIFKDNKIISEGYNYVPDIYGYTCDKCPRRNKDLHGGIGLELCYSVHAEESAINKVLLDKSIDSHAMDGASMVVVRIKDGKIFKSNEFKPYCTRCAEKIYTQTNIKEIIYQEKDGLVALTKDELFNDSIFNLYDNWKERFKF